MCRGEADTPRSHHTAVASFVDAPPRDTLCASMSADSSTDQELLEAWRGGDEGAGSTLVRRHFTTITRFFDRRVGGDLVEELLQQTFLGAVEAKTRVPDGVSFKAYLLGIARNKLLMHLRKKGSRAPTEALDVEPGASSAGRPSLFAAQREEERVLLRALRVLDLDLQIALELFYWEDLSTGEIAAVLEIPQGTVKTRLARARGLLRDQIQELSKTPELARSTIDGLDDWARGLAKAREVEPEA